MNLPFRLVYGEPNQLKKVFINIIKNAIEVTPEGGTITIISKIINNSQILISIQDEGPGIPKNQMKKLGEPFYTTKERGTGLGLMVSFKIIEEHHGRIQIESEKEKGTIFHITLPLIKLTLKSNPVLIGLLFLKVIYSILVSYPQRQVFVYEFP